jgi:hypothetical protein
MRDNAVNASFIEAIRQNIFRSRTDSLTERGGTQSVIGTAKMVRATDVVFKMRVGMKAGVQMAGVKSNYNVT